MDPVSAYIPHVTEYSPTEFSASVAVRPEISASFSLDMKVGTFGTDEAASDYLNQYVVLTNRSTDSTCPVAFISYDSKTKTVKFTPTQDLEPGATYTVSILAGFQAATGRGTTTDTNWTFTVAATDVSQVQLQSPTNASEVVVVPVLSWLSVPGTGATYQLQISDSNRFDNLLYDISGIETTSKDGLSSTVLKSETTYYWRVRAFKGLTYGQWSETYSFRIRAAGQAGSVFDTFGLISSYPPDGASNLADWPNQIRLVFNAPVDPNSVASGVAITAAHVDTAAAGEAPTLSPSVNSEVVTFAITGMIAENTRYTVSVLDVYSVDGVPLSNPTSFSFTGPYVPLYVSPIALKASPNGRFLRRYTDDEIAYQIHRSSVKCNRLVMDAGSSAVSVLLVERTLTSDMESYVTAHATYCLLQSYLFEILDQAGRSTRLDTLSVDTESRLIDDIENLLRELDKEVKRLEVILRGAPTPKVGVKSSQWDPSQLYDDLSISQSGRAKF